MKVTTYSSNPTKICINPIDWDEWTFQKKNLIMCFFEIRLNGAHTIRVDSSFRSDG